MAVTFTNYFNNAVVGQPMAGADFNIYEDHTLPRYAIGTGFTRSDGNKYRYCHFGDVVEVAECVATDNDESSVSFTNVVVAPSATYLEPGSTNIQIGAIGSRFVRGNFTLSADQVAGGYLIFQGDTSVGYTYRVRGNPSTVSSAINVELWDPLIVAVAADSDTSFIGSPYANLEPSTTTTDYRARGIATVGHSAASYGWICTKGVTAVTISGAVTGGAALMVGGVAGTVEVLETRGHDSDTNADVEIFNSIGQVLETSATTNSTAGAYVKFE